MPVYENTHTHTHTAHTQLLRLRKKTGIVSSLTPLSVSVGPRS